MEVRLNEFARSRNVSSLWTDLTRAFTNRDTAAWSSVQTEARKLLGVRERVERRLDLRNKLAHGGAPNWAHSIVESGGSQEIVGDPDLAADAWAVAQANSWISRLHAGANVDQLMARAHETSAELRRLVLAFASLSARMYLVKQMKDPQRRALETWLGAIRKVGKGTGKNAARFQRQARQALPAAMGAVPVWIMPIYRVLENFDPRLSEMFDVVIVDESSQCDLLSLGVLALGRKSVVVGDDKQTSPAAVGVVTSRIFELQNQYVSDFSDKSLLTLDESLYSISARAFPSTILLREHFRCVPDIIRFSNRFYGDRILPLREVTAFQIGDPLQVRHVADGVSLRAGSQRVNEREAEVLVEQVVKCAEDPSYDGLTFGVVTMMSGPQANIIEALLMERLGLEEFERRNLRVGTPPKFQGDERNVVFISFVADDNSFAATRESHAQWANVAASRAQDQLWLFHTMDPATLNANDYRRAMLEYATGRGTETEITDLVELTESKFEEDVLRAILERGYDVTPQHRVGAYRIDMVVNLAEGERMAIECDGDSFHGPEHWEQDVRRQRVLERLGWNFWRVRASKYYLDPDKALQPLWTELEGRVLRIKERKEARALQQERAAATRRHQEVDSLAETEVQAGLTSAMQGISDQNRDIQAQMLEDKDLAEEKPSAPPISRKAATALILPRKSHYSYASKSYEARALTTGERTRIRDWAIAAGYQVGQRGRIANEIVAAYENQRAEAGPDVLLAAQPVEIPAVLLISPSGEPLEPPSYEEIVEAWKHGTRYRLTSDGVITKVGSETTLAKIAGLEYATELARKLRAVRKQGGIFKVGDFGEMVTLIDEAPVFIDYCGLNELSF
jgi:very-short-patch-repair endonuclease